MPPPSMMLDGPRVLGPILLSLATSVGLLNCAESKSSGSGSDGDPALGNNGSGGNGSTSDAADGGNGDTSVPSDGADAGGSSVSGSNSASGDAGATPTGGGNSDGQDFLTAACGSDSLRGELTPANLLFVFDRSGSMNCNPPEGDAALNARCATNPQKEDPDAPSKWEVTRDALAEVLDQIVDRGNIKAGITVFPGEEPEDCSDEANVNAEPNVPLELLDQDQLEAIVDFMDGVTPEGRTPLAGATILSYAYLKQQIAAGDLEGNTFVVVLTDGEETCSESALEDLIQEHTINAGLAGLSVQTYVIGAPGSEGARGALSELAFKGQTATSDDCDRGGIDSETGDCHFDMTTTENFAEELTQALTDITTDRDLACVFNTPRDSGRTVDLAKVNISFTPAGEEAVPISQDNQDCLTAANGWQYINNFSQIQLCGEACELVKEDGEVRVVLGCPTDVVLLK